MIYPGLIYNSNDMPTQKDKEHEMHRAEGEMFTWCEICRQEEICIKCNGNGSIDNIPCIECESSGRRI